ncbi:hypothetical protein DRQ16_04895 [bacterium]|nr:MAG: hypothetical protein DRQ16_04895 [bacterium]
MSKLNVFYTFVKTYHNLQDELKKLEDVMGNMAYEIGLPCPRCFFSKTGSCKLFKYFSPDNKKLCANFIEKTENKTKEEI